MLTVDQVALRLGIDRDGVSKLIATKQLLGINVNRVRGAKRPTWRIRPEDLAAFELSRLSVQSPNVGTTIRTPKKKLSATKRQWF
jgi:hypothetical protein